MTNEIIFNETDKKRKREYDRADFLFALAVMPLAWIFVRSYVFAEFGLGTFIFNILAVVCAFGYLYAKKIKVLAESIVCSMIIVLFSIPYILHTGEYIHLMCFIFTLLLYVLWFFRTAYGYEKIIDGHIVYDMLKSILVMPFSCFGTLFAAVFGGMRSRTSKVLIAALGGLALSVIPSVVVIELLSDADEVFQRAVEDIMAGISVHLATNIIYIIAAIPVALYIYGLWYSSANRECANIMTDESTASFSKTLHVIPSGMTATAVIPLILIYALFFLSQLSYFFQLLQLPFQTVFHMPSMRAGDFLSCVQFR